MKREPQLRFPGFEGEWEEHRLGDIANLTSSKRIFLNEYTSEGIPFYRGKEISELKKFKVPEDILFISTEKYEDIKRTFGVPQIGDILLTAVGTLGNSYVVSTNKPFYFKDGNLIWFKELRVNSYFLDFIISSTKGKKRILDCSIGSTQKALTIVELNKLKFKFPSLPEQQKIADCLSVSDEVIELESQKLEQLRQYKKGLLQQIFSQSLRFPGFEGEWEEKKLKDVCYVQGGYAFKSQDFSNSGTRIIRIGDVQGFECTNDSTAIFTKKQIIDDKFIINEGDLLIALSGSTTVKTGVYRSDTIAYLNQRVGNFKVKNNKNFYYPFLYGLTESFYFRTELSKSFVGGVQFNIGTDDIEQLKVKIPNFPEQQKIAECLSNLDEVIKLESQKLEQLRQYKKGLLQQLFV